MLRKLTGAVVAATAFIGLATTAQADEMYNTVTKACETEIKLYCSSVEPGEGRLLACAYAHSDKLSGQCEYALYDAAVQLERMVSAMTYLVNECMDDAERLCAGVKEGEGRLLACLEENAAEVSPRCTQAIDDVIVKEE